MFASFMTRLFAFLLTVVSFFTNISTARQEKNVSIPENAVRIDYGSDVCEHLNLFIPETPAYDDTVLLMIHGGAWVFGTEAMFNSNCEDAYGAGFICATMDYKKIQNGANAYDMCDEVDMAVSAIKTELENRGFSPKHLILTGHSAGSHILLMYAYTRYETCPIDIAFVLSNSGPADFIKDAEAKTTTMGQQAHWALTGLSGEYIFSSLPEDQYESIYGVSPLYLVKPGVPPTILVHGSEDEMVPFENSTDTYNALVEAGVDAELVVYEGASHILGARFTEGEAARADAFYRFVEKYCTE